MFDIDIQMSGKLCHNHDQEMISHEENNKKNKKQIHETNFKVRRKIIFEN